MSPLRIIAVDWSGSLSDGKKKTWAAEVAGDDLIFLENGRTGPALAELLIGWARDNPRIVVGL
ncbi:MAG TPA: hypothetical protein VKC57_17850, partial [Ktedonobacterales bacterium]|nr:hypothetical protein [Ktedonobacterales bacterium]